MEIMFQFTCRGRLLFSSFHDRSFVDNYYYYWGMAGHPLYNVLVVLLINFLPMTGAFLLLHSLAPFSFPSGTLHWVAPSSIPIPAARKKSPVLSTNFHCSFSSSSSSPRPQFPHVLPWLTIFYHFITIVPP